MVDKKLSEFSAVNASDVSDLVVLFLDANNVKKNGRLSFSTFVSALALLAGNNTFTGDNTFSGDVVFSGNTTFNNEINAVALKAKQDSSGNVITETYATKTELQQKASFKLFYSDWFDSTMNDEDWLLANNFSWHPGVTYSNAYNHLVADISGISPSTETVGSYTVTYYQATDGHRICLPDQETTLANIYNESGVAWYYILDTANTRFKLPRENPAREELIQTIRAKGNGMTLGFTNGIDNMAIAQTSSSSTTIGLANTSYGKNVNSAAASESGWTTGIYGITTDPTKSGIISSITDSTSVYKGKKYLYFYVGQFSQTATEQTAGLNSELFNGKADINLSNAAPNASASAKQTIVGWGMPDYTAGVSKTDNTEYTADTNGWLEICTSCFNSSVSATLIINGVSRNIGTSPSGISVNYSISPIAKGSVYKVVYARTDAYQYINFYPCIGG